MKTGIVKKAVAVAAMFAGALCTFADDAIVDSVEASTGTLAANGNDWTASGLDYMAPDENDLLNRSEAGWYAGIKLTWAFSSTGSGLGKKYTGTKANSVKASFSDNAGRVIAEYNVYNSLGTLEQSQDGSGIQNGTQLGGLTLYMKTTDWNVWVTPEIMKTVSEKGEDYVATLTLTDGSSTNAYTITVPRTLELVDGNSVKWWPEPEYSGTVSLEGAEITLSATEVVVRGEPVGVAISQVTVDKVPLTEGTDYTVDDSSVMEASAAGEYTIKLNGIGNFTGSATATWKIIDPTGEFADDAMSIRKGDPAYGWVDPENPRRFEITNTVALVYRKDDGGERWEAAVEISWPRRETAFESYLLAQLPTKVQYVDAQHAAVKAGNDDSVSGSAILGGEAEGLSATTASASYYEINGLVPSSFGYEYFDKLTWTVSIGAADIADAVESGAKRLDFSIKCGSVAWGDETEGCVDGVKETEFTVGLGLANVFLLDDSGSQVYPEHVHDWSYSLSEDGATLAAKCAAPGCFLDASGGGFAISLASKDAAAAEYAEGHYRDGRPAEAVLDGAEEFAHTGAAIGEIKYFDSEGDELEGAPVEPGVYSASATVTAAEGQGESGSWTLRIGGLEILAGEAVLDGVHVPDAAAYFEKATGESMDISAGRDYTASRTCILPAKYGALGILSCGEKRFDLAGFEITAPVDGPLFENNGRLVIRDTSEGATGSVSANKASVEDTIIVNTGTLTIEGGTFHGSIANEGGSVSITGGRFTVRPDAAYVADGFDLVSRGGYWCVERHEHNYLITSLADRVLVATCANIFADGTLQVSHCPARMLVGVVGIRMLGLIPQLSVDYDRKEHPAEFYAINLTVVAGLLRADGLLDAVKTVIESDPANLDAEGVMALLAKLSEDADFASIIGEVGNIFVDKGEFEAMTGATIGEISYTKHGEPVEGAPVEAGYYAATLTVETAQGGTHNLRGSYRINEKELPIETEGHSVHVWTFDVDGARVTATCPGNSLLGISCNASPMGIELVPSAEGGRKEYDAAELSVVVSNLNTFVINTGATVSEVAYRTKDGESLDAPPVDPGEYVAEVVVTRTVLLVPVTYTASIDLVIDVRPGTGEFGPDALAALPSKGGAWGAVSADGTYATVADGTRLDYNAAGECWRAPLAVRWPADTNALSPSPKYTDPEHAMVSTEAGDDFSLVTAKFLSLAHLGYVEYVADVLWSPAFTLADAFAALGAGETSLQFEISVGSNGWRYNLDGLRTTTYRLVVPLEGLVLRRGDELIDVCRAYDLLVNTHVVSGLPATNVVVTVDGVAATVADDGMLGVYVGKSVAITPADGYLLTAFSVDGAESEIRGDGSVAFAMPGADVAVKGEVVRDIGNAASFRVTAQDIVYTGGPLSPVVAVVDLLAEESQLVEGTDYTLACTDANGGDIAEIVEVGRYSVVVTGVGAFGGTAVASFSVTDKSDEFAEYKARRAADAGALEIDGDSEACKSLVAGAKTSIASIAYDRLKSLDEQKSAVDAVVKALASALAAQRAVEKQDVGLTLYEEVAGEVDLSKASKWLAYMRSPDGEVVASLSISVGKISRNKQTSKAKVVVTYPGVSRRVRIAGELDSAGRMTIGDDVLVFGADMVKGTFAGCEVDGSRNVFSSSRKSDKPVAKAAAAQRKGYYTAAWGDSTNGWTVASVYVSAKGRARLKGNLPSGKTFSASGCLAPGEEVDAVTFVDTRKRLSDTLNVWFVEGGGLVLEGLDADAEYTMAAIGAGGVAVPSSAMLSTAFLDFDIALEGRGRRLVGSSPKATVSVSVKTGQLKGSFKVGKRTARVSGYYVDGVGYGSARLGKVYAPLELR